MNILQSPGISSQGADTVSPTDGARHHSLADEALRRDRSLSRKAELLHQAVREFCELDRPARQDIEVFKELFYQLVGACRKSDKRSIAAALSRNIYCPRTILMYLAMQDPDIAAPILMFNAAINEADIAILAEKLPLKHLMILSRRTDLSETSASMLRKYGGPECAKILLANTALNPAARENTPEPVRYVPPAAGHRDRSAVLEQAPGHRPAESAPIPATYRETREISKQSQSLRETIVGLAARGGRLGREKPERPAITATNIAYNADRPLDQQMVATVRAGGIPAMASLIESHCGLPAATIVSIANNGGLESSCVLFKGLGLGMVSMLQLALLVDRETGRSQASYEAAKSLLRRLDAEKCRQFLIEIGAWPDGLNGRAPNTRRANAASLDKALENRQRAIASDSRTGRHPHLARAG